MSRSSQVTGAHINPILIIVAAIAALALVLLVVLNPPRVVDAPPPPDTPVETPIETPNETPVETPETPEDPPVTTPPETPNNNNENISNSCTPELDSSPNFELRPANDSWAANINSETQEILEQVISAYGGLENLESFRTMYGKGESTITAQGDTVKTQIELWIRMPNQVRNLVKFPLPIPGQFIETLIVWAGENGWSKAPNQTTLQPEVVELGPELKLQAIEEIEINPILILLNVKQAAAQFTYLGLEQIECGEAHAVQFRTELGSTGVYYYDPATFRTIKLRREGGGVVVEKYYDKYTSSDELSFPVSIRTVLTTDTAGSFITELNYEEIQVNLSLDDELFEEPTLD